MALPLLTLPAGPGAQSITSPPLPLFLFIIGASLFTLLSVYKAFSLIAPMLSLSFSFLQNRFRFGVNAALTVWRTTS